MTTESTLAWIERLAWGSLVVGAFMVLLGVMHLLGLSPVHLRPFRTDALKQLTGYTLLVLILINVLYGLWRASSSDTEHFHRRMLIHQILGLITAVGLLLHASAVPSGYLQLVWGLGAALAVSGGLRHQKLWPLSPTWHRRMMGIHITTSCLVLMGGTLHLYFVYTYASA